MKEKQFIISISREYGSAGHEIAQKLAEELGLPLYDRNILEQIADKMNTSVEVLEKYDERPRNKFLTRTVNGYSNSMEENLSQMQFDYLRSVAKEGNSFVVVGRCSETVFRSHEGLVSIFVTGDRETKISHVMEKYQLSRGDAIAKINRHDKKRKAYHNHFSDHKWGSSLTYDLCINSSRLGVDLSVDILKKYLEDRMKAYQ